MKSKKGLFCILIGIAMIVAALSLALFNYFQSQKSGDVAQEYLSELIELIPEDDVCELPAEMPSEDNILAEYGIQDNLPEEATAEIDSYNFLGYITIPDIGIELPVLSEYRYENLKISPCRYSGTVAEGNLIICAHNYSTHFGRINELNTGSVIYFTECSGEVHEYEVIETNLIDGYNSAAMSEGDDEWDLTLFTCTLGGTNRVTVRAVEN
jgi:sortase A